MASYQANEMILTENESNQMLSLNKLSITSKIHGNVKFLPDCIALDNHSIPYHNVKGFRSRRIFYGELFSIYKHPGIEIEIDKYCTIYLYDDSLDWEKRIHEVEKILKDKNITGKIFIGSEKLFVLCCFVFSIICLVLDFYNKVGNSGNVSHVGILSFIVYAITYIVYVFIKIRLRIAYIRLWDEQKIQEE